jgi:HK97 family phage prohead protease
MNQDKPALLECRPIRTGADVDLAKQEMRVVTQILDLAAQRHGPAFAHGLRVGFNRGVLLLEHRDDGERARLTELRQWFGKALTPPPLARGSRERRAVATLAPLPSRPSSMRSVPAGRTLVGLALVFGQWSVDLGGFREAVAREAINYDLTQKTDIRALADHDGTRLLGRVSSGTLRLSADGQGLRAEIVPPDTSVGRDVVVLVERGDLKGMSFAFRTIRDEWQRGTDLLERVLLEIRISEVSTTAVPAYPQTTLSLRGALAAKRAELARLLYRGSALAAATRRVDALRRADRRRQPGETLLAVFEEHHAGRVHALGLMRGRP